MLNYDNERIYCGNFSITYEEAMIHAQLKPNKPCKMKVGDELIMTTLFTGLLFDYGFEMSNKIEEL